MIIGTLGEIAPITAVTAFLLTYILHSSLFIILALLIDQRRWFRSMGVREALWKTALFGGLLSSSLQLSIGVLPTTKVVRNLPVGTVAESVNADEPEISDRPSEGLVRTKSSEGVSRADYADIDGSTDTFPSPGPTYFLSRAAAFWPPALVSLWLVGACVLFVRYCYQWVALKRVLRSRIPLIAGLQVRLLQGLLCDSRHPTRVRLSLSRFVWMPLAIIGFRRQEIVLPQGKLDELTTDEQKSILAHELAHLIRRDGVWLHVRRLHQILFFVQPLNLIATRRLADITEMRCDDWVVRLVNTGEHLASALEKAGKWAIHGKYFAMVPAMASRNSFLKKRVLRLVSDQPEEETFAARFGRVGLCGAVFLLIVVFGPAIDPRTTGEPSGAKSMRTGFVTEHGGEIEAGKFGSETQVGKPVSTREPVSETISLVQDISRAPTERSNTPIAQVVVASRPDGELTYSFRDNKGYRIFDKPGQQWLAGTLSRVLSNRVAGVKATFEELTSSSDLEALWNHTDQTEDPELRAEYYRLAFTELPLEPTQRRDVLERAAHSLAENDWHLWTLLNAIRVEAMQDPQVVDGFLHSVAEIDLAWQRADLFDAVLADGRILEENLPGLLRGFLEGLDDLGKFVVMLEAMDRFIDDTRMMDSYIGLVETVADEHVRRGLLMLYLRANADSSGQAGKLLVDRVLQCVSFMSGDMDKADVLNRIGKFCPGDSETLEAYLDMVKALPTRTLRKYALKAFFERSDVGDEAIRLATLLA